MLDKSTLNLKPISADDREAFEAVSHRFEAYSDFNFFSFLAWNSGGTHSWAKMDLGIAIRISDYVSGRPFYSYLGNENVEDAINRLLQLSELEMLEPELRLVPEVVVRCPIPEHCIDARRLPLFIARSALRDLIAGLHADGEGEQAA